MYKVIVLTLIVLIIILIGNIYITREGFNSSTTQIENDECEFQKDGR